MANNTPPPNWPKGEPYAPYIPNGPSTPGTDYDKNPTKNWYPNGQYGWDDPYLNGDAQTRNERYPHYWSYGDPDPNWRPSFYGETPPWNRNPNDTTGSANTQKGQWFGNTGTNKLTPEQRAREKAEYEREDAARAGAKQADRDSDAAFWAAGGKKGHLSNGRTFAIYPPGWTGQRKWDEFNFDPEKDFKSGPLKFQWDQAPAGTTTGGTPAPAPGPTAGPTAAPPPAPGPTAGPTAAPPPAPGPAAAPPPAPTTGPRPWDPEGYNKPWVDNNGTTHYEPRGSGPQQSQEEVAYWAGLAKTDPKHWMTSRAKTDNDPNWGMKNAINYVKGDNGKYHAAVDEQYHGYKSATDEQKAWGANTVNEFNKQFDPNNEVDYAERHKNARFYQLQAMDPELRDRIMANAGQNTPAAKAAMATWGDAINRYKAQSQPAPGPTQRPPGPTQPPPANVQGQPQQPGQPPPANMGDARFHNGNPYYNGKGNLRMPFRNAIAGQMMSDMQSQQQPATSWNMGGQNGQAMFGTQNQYSYWPQGGQQGYGMGAPSSNPYQQSYGPPQTMNYYGGQQGYGMGAPASSPYQQSYGPPQAMPNYGSGQQGYGGGGQYGGQRVAPQRKASDVSVWNGEMLGTGKPWQGPDLGYGGQRGYDGHDNQQVWSYGGGRGYGEPPMPNYSQNSGYGGGRESYGGGRESYGGAQESSGGIPNYPYDLAAQEDMRNRKAQWDALTPEQRAAHVRNNQQGNILQTAQ